MTPDEAFLKVAASGPFEIVKGEVSGYETNVFRNAPQSIREILKQTQKFGDLPFLIYEDETCSFAEHFERVAAVAHFLISIGVKKGDRVAIGMRNYPEWSISFCACQAVGGVAVPLNAWWTGAELAFALKDSEPVALIVDGERLERLDQELDKLSIRNVVVVHRGDAQANATEFGDVLSDYAAPDLPDVDVGSEDLSTILYTSGTTGNPKGAMACHRNHVSNIYSILMRLAAGRVAMGESAELPVYTPQEQLGSMQTFPFFHTGGLTNLLVGLALGTRIALMYKWSVAEALDLIEKHRLTSVGGVPYIVRQLLDEASRTNCSLDTLVTLSSGAAPVPSDLIDRIGSQFSNRVMASNGYGLTETSGAVVTNGGPDYFDHPNSVGRVIPVADVRIVNDAGEDAEPGEVGEFWARGPTVIGGYWRNEAANEAAFSDGWFRSGDLGYVDSEGWYYLVDRMKDVIIRGGENIYCAEVEASLLEFDDVLEAALVGVPHAEYGEEVAAVLQVKPGSKSGMSEEDIREHLNKELAQFKIPSIYRFIEDDLPRNATGKILKQEVKAKYFSANNG